MATPAAAVHSIETRHTDMIHDAQFDYYAKRLATASSDGTVTVYDVSGSEHRESAVLSGHTGPVWEVTWAHPKFGCLVASCGYDRQVIVHKETSEHTWQPVHYHRAHDSSVNSVAWAPHEHGLVLACASSDGRVTIVTHKDDNSWQVAPINDSKYGVNAVTWAPFGHLGSRDGDQVVKRIATGSCDKLVRVYRCIAVEGRWEWRVEKTLGGNGGGHTDWVRDVAWAPASGMPCNLIASCSEDGTVIIWKQVSAGGDWKPTKLPPFSSPVWRVSWSVTGNMLAVSCGDQAVSLWSETLDGKWKPVSAVGASGAAPAVPGAGAGAGAGMGAGAGAGAGAVPPTVAQ